MAFCEQCGAKLMEDARFCQECGSPTPQPVVRLCAGCGQPLPDDAAFCPSCGLFVNAAAAVESEQTDEALVITVTEVEDVPVAAEIEQPAEEAVDDQEFIPVFQMDVAELSSIADMLTEGVQADQERLLDLVRQTASSAE